MSDKKKNKAPETFGVLTPRQRQVAAALALGKTNREIAIELGCGIKTVDTHRGAVLRRLQIRNNVELARHALRAGLVTLDQQAT